MPILTLAINTITPLSVLASEKAVAVLSPLEPHPPSLDFFLKFRLLFHGENVATVQMEPTLSTA